MTESGYCSASIQTLARRKAIRSILRRCWVAFARPQPLMWPGDDTSTYSSNFHSGMAVTLKHGANTLLGLLILASEEDNGIYDENHFRLFKGIGRQAALALRNAELYEILASHAERLEDMVAERTAELQSAQQLLVRSEKLASIGHLAASIAHEINNPLQPISHSSGAPDRRSSEQRTHRCHCGREHSGKHRAYHTHRQPATRVCRKTYARF